MTASNTENPIGLIPVSEALDMRSGEAMVCGWGDTDTVRDGLTYKRASSHYQDLLTNIRHNGINTPVLIEISGHGYKTLVEGHHRITAALDLGLDAVPFTTDRTLFHRIDDMPWQLLSHGTLTDEGIQVFRGTASAGLAIALHDATGWPLIEVGHCDGLPMHFLVRHPNGHLMDVEGLHPDDHVVTDFELDADEGIVLLSEVTRAAVWTTYRDDCGEPVPLPIAHSAAAAVLDRLTVNTLTAR